MAYYSSNPLCGNMVSHSSDINIYYDAKSVCTLICMATARRYAPRYLVASKTSDLLRISSALHSDHEAVYYLLDTNDNAKMKQLDRNQISIWMVQHL